MNKPLPHPQISEPVSKFLAGKHQAFIAGKWMDAVSGSTFELSIPGPDESSLKSPNATLLMSTRRRQPRVRHSRARGAGQRAATAPK